MIKMKPEQDLDNRHFSDNSDETTASSSSSSSSPSVATMIEDPNVENENLVFYAQSSASYSYDSAYEAGTSSPDTIIEISIFDEEESTLNFDFDNDDLPDRLVLPYSDGITFKNILNYNKQRIKLDLSHSTYPEFFDFIKNELPFTDIDISLNTNKLTKGQAVTIAKILAKTMEQTQASLEINLGNGLIRSQDAQLEFLDSIFQKQYGGINLIATFTGIVTADKIATAMKQVAIPLYIHPYVILTNTDSIIDILNKAEKDNFAMLAQVDPINLLNSQNSLYAIPAFDDLEIDEHLVDLLRYMIWSYLSPSDQAQFLLRILHDKDAIIDNRIYTIDYEKLGWNLKNEHILSNGFIYSYIISNLKKLDLLLMRLVDAMFDMYINKNTQLEAVAKCNNIALPNEAVTEKDKYLIMAEALHPSVNRDVGIICYPGSDIKKYFSSQLKGGDEEFRQLNEVYKLESRIEIKDHILAKIHQASFVIKTMNLAITSIRTVLDSSGEDEIQLLKEGITTFGIWRQNPWIMFGPDILETVYRLYDEDYSGVIYNIGAKFFVVALYKKFAECFPTLSLTMQLGLALYNSKEMLCNLYHLYNEIFNSEFLNITIEEKIIEEEIAEEEIIDKEEIQEIEPVGECMSCLFKF